VTEPGVGSDVAAIETRASNIWGGVVINGYMLNGSKQFITNADMANFMVVWAQTFSGGGNQTLGAFIVDLPNPRVKIIKRENKMGLHASHTNSLSLEEVFVPTQNILGRIGDGFKMAMQVFNRSRLGIAASCLGFMRRAIDETIRYTSQRKMFGGTLLDMQNTRMELARMEATRYILESAVYRAAWQADQGQDIRKEAAIVKYMASDSAVKIVDRAVQLHGGSGYMRDYFIEQLYRDVRAYPLFEGANEVQLLTIAKNLLKA
jgi:alkylation response protein AidB-like acyl-CoA dehydrogenase